MYISEKNYYFKFYRSEASKNLYLFIKYLQL
jgi:hypothetical protein